MAKRGITAKQRAARKLNMATARAAKKKVGKKKKRVMSYNEMVHSKMGGEKYSGMLRRM